MRKRIATAILFSAIIHFTAQSAYHPKQQDTGADNVLTKQEKAAGWKLLFDGKTMHGWRTYQNKPQTSWYVSNGVIGCKYDTSHTYQHADLITGTQYKNFELSIDWKIEPGANSGILYMVNEKYEYPY